jgi:serpin B
MRKSLIGPTAVAAALLVSMLWLAACGSEPALPTTTTVSDARSTGVTGAVKDGELIAASDLTRVTTSAPQADIASAADAVNAFGADLYGILVRGAAQGNLVFSPASIDTALAMTYAGANGDTAAEMASTLHFKLQGDALHQAFNSLDSILESRNWQGKDDEGKDIGVVVQTANSLWAQKDLAFEKVFLDTLARDYGAGVRLVDYKTAAEDARVAINKWVADQTNDKIPELIPGGALDALTRLVLVNAVYLNATWANQFDKDSTRDGSFTTLAGATVTAPVMSQSAGFAYGKGNGWQTIELPYVQDRLAMLLIVPDQGQFGAVEAQLKSGLVDQAVAALGDVTEVELTMPKFKFRTQAGLADALKALGMKKAFDGMTADFSGMTKDETLFISDVIHEAYIAVDEKGTEAAAATAVIMRAMAMPAPALQMTIDRPFLFALRDKDTGAVLFLGRMTDPTAE